MKQKIVVVGASGHSKVLIDIVERQGTYEIGALLDDNKPVGMRVLGYDVLGSQNLIPSLISENNVIGGIVAIGHNWIRAQVVRRIQALAPDFQFITAIHPFARIARDVEIGPGTAIMAGVSVNPGAKVGEFCFLNTNSSVDHDNVLGDFSCLQPNAATGGNVRLGAYSAISMGANVIHGISIGEHTVIGAGSTVLHHIPDNVVAYGTPCRVIRPRMPEDNYY